MSKKDYEDLKNEWYEDLLNKWKGGHQVSWTMTERERQRLFCETAEELAEQVNRADSQVREGLSVPVADIDNYSSSYKFNEDKTLKELQAFIDQTYQGHYVGKNNIQAFDLIRSNGHGLGFCIGNAIKYATRYGKKEGFNRKDILKALHYLIMALYVHDDEKEPGKEV